jgi:hypothetical protein
VCPYSFRHEKTHLWLNYVWEDALFDLFFPRCLWLFIFILFFIILISFPFQSHLELFSLCLMASWTTIFIYFSKFYKKHELNKSWNSLQYKSIYKTLFGKKDVICKLLHPHVEYKVLLGKYITTSPYEAPYEAVKDIIHKRKTKKMTIFEWNCFSSSKAHIAKIFAMKHI